MRKLNPLGWGGILAGLCLLCLGIGLCTAVFILNSSTGTGQQDVEIKKGMTVGQIGQVLFRERLIRSPRLLRIFAYLNGTSRRLTAGMHPLSGHMTTWQVLLELERPRDVTADVTLREGLQKGEVAEVLATKLNLDRTVLLSLMNSPDFCKQIGVKAKDLEGYLFPETYRFSVATTEKQVLRVMVEHFKDVFNKRLQKRSKEMGMSIHEVMTLASIVEGEAQVDKERPIIAAVYHNRLKSGMRLQADPTVQYALPDGPRRLFNKDYWFDSPYNTYRHGGLPPGPIGNPGRASIEATLFPADVAYLYFVAKGNGGHIFSKTAKEHEAAKRQTLSARRNSWRKTN